MCLRWGFKNYPFLRVELSNSFSFKRKSLLFSAFLLLFYFLSVSFSSANNPRERVRYNFWPLFFYQTSSDQEIYELEIFGPFIYQYKTPLEEGFSLRPLLSSFKKKDKCYELYYLTPLGTYKDCTRYTRSHFVPLWGHNANYLQESSQKDESRHHGFLLFFWGQSKSGQKYHGFFPFYGRLLDWRGKEETKFILWPLRVTSRWGGNYSSTWFWPIYNRTDGPTFYERKFWPFYGHKVKKGVFDRTFFLWPFFWHEKFNFSSHLTTRDMFFPFWIYERSNVHSQYTFLWPFFRHYHHYENETVSWDLPWPFFRYGESKKKTYHERKLWPLIGYKREKRSYSYFFLWPLYKYERVEIPHKNKLLIKETRRFYLLSKIERVWDEKGKTKYEFTRWWPLGEKMKRDDGFEYFYFPALIPFHSEGVDRNYAPLLRLYEYVKDPRGFSRSKWFWGLYRHDQTPEESFVDVAFIINYHRFKEGWEFNLFKGLLGVSHQKDGLHFKFFFLRLF